MEFLGFPVDPLVQPSNAYESPEYLPDCIAVAAEECYGNFSQGSSSPETYYSVPDDVAVDLLDDFNSLNENDVNELVNGLVCEDPSFGSVLIDDINLFDESYNHNASNVIVGGDHVPVSPHLSFETQTRRKQRIVPIGSQSFFSDCNDRSVNNPEHQSFVNRKRSWNAANDVVFSEIEVHAPPTYDDNDVELSPKFQKKDPFNLHSLKTEKGKASIGVQGRKRGLTHDERKERKKQSNRNASYRYRQRKKEEMDNFVNVSSEILQSLEKEKEGYYNIFEEFIRCIKHAKLVNDARR